MMSEPARAEGVPPVGEAMYQEVFEFAADAVLVVSGEGRIVRVNRQAEAMFGYRREELLDQPLELLVPERHRERHAQHVAGYLVEPRVRALGTGLELCGRRRDGSEFPVDILLSPLARAGGTMVIATVRDRSDRQAAEEALAARTGPLAAIHAVITELARELDLPALLGLIIRRAAALVDADAGAVYLWDEGAQALLPRAWHGLGDWIGAPRVRPGEGVVGQVAQHREGIIVSDLRASPSAPPALLAHARITAMVAEPLLHRDRLVGVIALGTEQPGRAFTVQDRKLLACIAAPAAMAIENARLLTATGQAAREAQSLSEIAHTLTTSLDPAEVLRLVAVKTTELLGTPHAQVVLWDEATRTLALGAAHGTEAERVRTQVFRLGEGVNGIVAQTRAPLLVNEYQAFPHRVPWLTEVVGAIGVPLLYRDRLLGVLTSHATQPGWAFTPAHLALLTSFADQAASALENARLYGEIQRHASRLEARVDERTRDVVAANEALEAASRHRSEFLANMSHELRTPLNSIIGFAEVLLRQGFGPLTAKQARYLGHIHQAGRHLLQLISDILDLSKMEAGRLTLQPKSLSAHTVVEEALGIARGLARQKEQSVEAAIAPDLPPVWADPVRLKQILLNLLSNAVKFTPEAGRITLSARRVKGTGPEGGSPAHPPPLGALAARATATEWLELRVTDTGIGIKPEDLPRLFQAFVQLEAPISKRHEGTGLGLALTKRLVELHGGAIWAESEGLGAGASFLVWLPLREPPPPKRILVVEDQAPVLEALGAALQAAGYAVECAQSGTEALAALTGAQPDLLLLDISLPDMEGWTILERVRGQEATPALPVLVLTGMDQVRAEHALARGADEFLAKPISPRVLVETVARLLARPARGRA